MFLSSSRGVLFICMTQLDWHPCDIFHRLPVDGAVTAPRKLDVATPTDWALSREGKSHANCPASV